MALKGVMARMTPVDRGIVVAMALAIAAAFFWLMPTGSGERLLVERDGRIIYTAPLNEDRNFNVEGPLGTTCLSVEGGAVSVRNSPCPGKICLGMGKIARPGEILACVPNHLLIRIDGRDSSGETGSYDLLSR